MATLKAIPNLTQSQPLSELEDEQGQSTVLGWHVVADFWGCNREIDNPEYVERAVRDAADASKSTTLQFGMHKFHPHGVTAFALLSGSHLSVHSWPEHRYLAADIYVCGEGTDPAAAVELLRSRFEPDRVDCRRLSRGVLPREVPDGLAASE